MSDKRDRATATAESYEKHLARSRRVWNRWSDWYRLSESDFEPMREAVIDELELEAGDRVLDVGCGPGVNFEYVRRAIGETGELVAVDYSPAMVEKARERIGNHGWENVEVVCADAASADLRDGFDAAIATLSMSIMPDVERAVENVHGSLSSDGAFVVLDLRPVPDGPLVVLNPFLRWFLRWYANRNDEDVLDALAAVFEEHEVLETYFAGTTYAAVARKRPRDASR